MLCSSTIVKTDLKKRFWFYCIDLLKISFQKSWNIENSMNFDLKYAFIEQWNIVQLWMNVNVIQNVIDWL